MTEKLAAMLHEQAERQRFETPDVTRLVAAGDRRVRRRRGLTAVGAVAAVAFVGTLAVTQWTGADGDHALAADPLPTGQVSWATGSTLHTPGGSTDLGRPVRAYVRTAEGYVFADPKGTVWSFVDDRVSEVGATDPEHPRLVGDPDGALAGWVDATGAHPTFVVLDQGTGGVTSYDEHTSPGMGLLADEADPAYFYAIDDGTGYWRDERGAVAVDLTTGTATVVDATASNGFDVIDAENGLVALDTGNGRTLVGATVDTARPLRVHGAHLDAPGAFSPDGRYLSVDADEPIVVEVATGRRVDFDLAGFATGYEWLDASTVVMIASSDGEQVDLLACAVPAGTCRAAASDLGTFDELQEGDFALPIGEGLAD